MKTNRHRISSKLVSLLLALTMVLSMAPMAEVKAADYGSDQGVDIEALGTDTTTEEKDITTKEASVEYTFDGLALTIKSAKGFEDWARDVEAGVQDKYNVYGLIISEGITEIPESAFAGYANLLWVEIPASVVSIKDRAFVDCSFLMTVTVRGTEPPALGELVFTSGYDMFKIAVPIGSAEKYRGETTGNGWQQHKARIYGLAEFLSVEANGESEKSETTVLTLTFDSDIPGLTKDDIKIKGESPKRGAAISELQKDAERSGVYTVGLTDRKFRNGDTLTVTVNKDGCVFGNGNRKIVVYTKQYAITVENDGNGTAVASAAKAENGTEITLTATPNTGYRFKEWQAVSGGVTIADNKFLMPESDVAVKAIFEVIPATEYAITAENDGNGTATASAAKAEKGTEIILTATPNTGYRFKEWQAVSGGVTIADNKFIMPESDVAVKAIFEVIPPTEKIKVDLPKLVKTDYVHTGAPIKPQFTGFDANVMKVTGDEQTNVGSYKATVSLIDTSKYEWNTENNKDGAWEYKWNIIENKPKTIIFHEETGTSVEGVGGTTFDPETVLVVTNKSGDINKYAAKVEALAAGKTIAGLYDFKLMLGESAVQPSGKIKIKIPLTAEIKAMQNLQAIYIDDEGKVSIAESTVNGNYMEITTDHLSMYGVIGTKAAPTPAPTAVPTTAPTAKPTSSAAPSPKTGDNNNSLFMGLALLVISGGATAVLVIKRKAKKIN